MVVPDEVAETYRRRLIEHINFVHGAGAKIGVEYHLLESHDSSKWLPIEFDAYALHFCGGGAPKEFARAWLHHIHNNPHHWLHWIFSDGWSVEGSDLENGVMEMPRCYALEMIADWMGASRAYTGSWDMTDWLIKNLPKIKLHSKTVDYVESVLTEHGYGSVYSLLRQYKQK
jgi:hypothetical protein